MDIQNFDSCCIQLTHEKFRLAIGGRCSLSRGSRRYVTLSDVDLAWCWKIAVVFIYQASTIKWSIQDTASLYEAIFGVATAFWIIISACMAVVWYWIRSEDQDSAKDVIEQIRLSWAISKFWFTEIDFASVAKIYTWRFFESTRLLPLSSLWFLLFWPTWLSTLCVKAVYFQSEKLTPLFFLPTYG